ncbi:MAG: Dabb family protein [Advenella sp.]
MFLHIVLMQFSNKADTRFFQQVVHHTTLVKRECEGLLMYHFGENIADRSQGYTHATSAAFANSAAHDVYQACPSHVAMKQFMEPYIERIVVYDGMLPSASKALNVNDEHA